MSTGIVLRPLTDPKEDATHDFAQRLIRAERLLADETTRRRAAEADLEDAQRENRSLVEGVNRLRSSLNPLYESLKLLYGDMEAIGIEDAAAAGAPAAPKHSAVWDSWKAKLPSGEAKAIDALLLHGKLTTPQIRIHVGCATRTAQNLITSLKSKGLITGDGKGWSLKPL